MIEQHYREKFKYFEEQIVKGERLTFNDGLSLFDMPLYIIGRLVEIYKNIKKINNFVYFNINRHINLTNICVASCKFCSFQRKFGDSDAYIMTEDDVSKELDKLKDTGVTEIHIVNGLHPDISLEYYKNIIQLIKSKLPDVNVKAFTATEIHYFEKRNKRTAESILKELMDVGLVSITGGGAEIFDTKVRSKIIGHDTDWDHWSRIHKVSHSLGMKTPATMLYGHIESKESIIDHLCKLRELQDITNGFSVFVPLRYQFGGRYNKKNLLEKDVKQMANLRYVLKVISISRLLLDNIPIIKIFWVMHGLSASQISLFYGANDFDGSISEYKITKDADNYNTPDTLYKEDFITLIKNNGFIPVERDTLYNIKTIYK